jgi:hypothetical protein
VDAVAVAFVSVVSSGVVAVAGLFVTYRGGRDQRSQDRRLEEIRLEKEFLVERYRHRLNAYPPVMRSLGAVSDAELMEDDPDLDVLLAPDRLHSAADELREHLYGEAGLLMDKETRDWIWTARFRALQYESGSRTAEDRANLAEAFNQSRRAIRRDLGMIDDVAPTTVGSLAERLSDRTDRRTS